MKNLDESTKQMIKKFGIILGVLIILFVVLLIVMSIGGGKKNDSQLLNIMENAARKYYTANSEKLPKSAAEKVSVSSEELISGKYMKSFDKLTKNTGCTGKVNVTKNGDEYLYIPSLKCSDYKSTTIAEKVESTMVTSGDGLYLDGTTYYFKGEYPNNYIRLDKELYRIVSIDTAGYIKLISSQLIKNGTVWDDRYNAEKNATGMGINDYSKSRLKENVQSEFGNLPVTVKKYATQYEWCVGKRSSDVINDEECLEKITDYAGIITASEFAKASLDTSCTNVFSGMCSNYNYLSVLHDKNAWTSTGLTSATYKVVGIEGRYLREKSTGNSGKYAIMFHIDGDNVYVSGTGTETDPYIIK